MKLTKLNIPVCFSYGGEVHAGAGVYLNEISNPPLMRLILYIERKKGRN